MFKAGARICRMSLAALGPPKDRVSFPARPSLRLTVCLVLTRALIPAVPPLSWRAGHGWALRKAGTCTARHKPCTARRALLSRVRILVRILAVAGSRLAPPSHGREPLSEPCPTGRHVPTLAGTWRWGAACADAQTQGAASRHSRGRLKPGGSRLGPPPGGASSAPRGHLPAAHRRRPELAPPRLLRPSPERCGAVTWRLSRTRGGQVSVALQLNAIFNLVEKSQQLSADFILLSNWTDLRCASPAHPQSPSRSVALAAPQQLD